MTSRGHGASSQEPPTVTFDQVRQAELEQIAKRRKVAFGAVQSPDEIRHDLAGLALSGGGIRSAAMSLGLLQAMQARGDLKRFDYLSTVSGGGYAGAYLSTLALSLISEHNNHPETAQPDGGDRTGSPSGESSSAASAKNAKTQAGADPLELAPLDDGSQPACVLRLMFESRYLRRPLGFANRYLASLILMLAMSLSGLVAFSSLTAWTYAQMWRPEALAALAALGFRTDIQIALFPAFVMLVLWLVTWGISIFRYGSRATGKTARVLFFVLVFVFAVGIAGLFGTGDISLRVAAVQGTDKSKQVVGKFEETVQILIYSAIGASLLPYLTPQRLLRSGVAPRNTLERATFWFASRALVFGMPFVCIAYFAQENISGINNQPRTKFYATDFADWQLHEPWSPFWRRLWADKQSNDEVASAIWKPKFEKSFDDLETRIKGMRDYSENQASYGRGWWYLGKFAIDSILSKESSTSEFLTYYRNHLECRRIKQELADAVTETLKDSRFDEKILKSNEDGGWIAALFRVEPRQQGPVLGPDGMPNQVYRNQLEYAKGLSGKDRAASAGNAPLEAQHNIAPGGRTDAGTPRTSWQPRAIWANNRDLLEAKYRDMNFFRNRGLVFAYVVLDADQTVRWTCFEISGIVFLALFVAVNLNGTSLHGFYAEEIARMWVSNLPEDAANNIRLSQLNTTGAGYPYHLISGAWHRLGGRAGDKACGRRDHFLFSHRFCGSDDLGFAPTTAFMQGKYALADAIAISGAAVNPMQFDQPLVRLLLFLANIRLGQWLDNPRRILQSGLKWFSPRPAIVLANLLSRPENRRACFVSDGGLYENLGIEPLLRRRCRLIVALDATEDAAYSFADFAKLARWMAVRHGIHLEPLEGLGRPVDCSPLMPTEPDSADRSRVLFGSKGPDGEINFKSIKLSKAHHIVCRVAYPDGPEDALLIYLKSSLTGDEPPDLLGKRRADSEFPHNPTSNQFFDAATFDAYRALGFHMWESSRPKGIPGGVGPDPDIDGFVAAVTGLCFAEPKDKGNGDLELLLNRIKDHTQPIADRELALGTLAEGNYDPKITICALVGLAGARHNFNISICKVLKIYAPRDAKSFLKAFDDATTINERVLLAQSAYEAAGQDVAVDRQLIDRLERLAGVNQPTKVRFAARQSLQEFCTPGPSSLITPENRHRAKESLERTATPKS